MGSTHLEVERKFELPEGTALPALRGLLEILPSGLRLHLASQENLEANYFDTADHRLFHAAWTLRRRTGGRDGGWHLKVPQGHDARLEVRQPLGRSARIVPIALRRLAWIHTRDRSLLPVATVSTVRTIHELRDETGTVLLEVAEDAVTAQRLEQSGDDGVSSSEPTSWREIEIEVVDGDRALLKQAAKWFRTYGAERSTSPSKLSRALGVVPSLSEPSRDDHKWKATSPAGDLIGAYLREQIREIHARDPHVRLQVPDSVHKMRVATRRLRSALKTFKPMFVPGTVRPLEAELKWLAGELGRVRDAEVQRARLHDALDAESSRQLLGRGVGRVVDGQAAREQREALITLRAVLDSERYRLLVGALDELLDNPSLTHRARKSAAKVLPSRVALSYEHLATTMRSAARLPDGVARDEALHAARKSAKRARYAAEAIAPAFGKPARGFAACMEDLQEALGEHHDAVVMLERLHALALAQDSAPAAFTYGRIHARHDLRREYIDAGIDSAWQRACRPVARKWLA